LYAGMTTLTSVSSVGPEDIEPKMSA